MAKTIQFEEFDGGGSRNSGGQARPVHCVACDEMLADALDGSLGEIDQAWFDRHVQSCAECGSMLADAQRGVAWLELLKSSRPEPSARLMERILAKTTGAETRGTGSGEAALPMGQAAFHAQMVPALTPAISAVQVPVNLLAFRPRAAWRFEPRLAMTAAMAFFSLALTLNLTGVRLNELHVSDLKPASLKHGYYEASTQALRYYDNLRVVRVMESRVDDLRETQRDEAAPARRERGGQVEGERGGQSPDPDKAPAAKQPAGPGVSRREEPKGVPAGSAGEPGVHAVDERGRRRGGAAASTMQMEGGLA